MMSMPKETKHDKLRLQSPSPPTFTPTLSEGRDVGQVQSARGENFNREQTLGAPYEHTDTNSQLLLLLVVVSWHTGEGFSLAQRVSAEGGAT